VFFIQDGIKFPVKEDPDCAFPQAQSAHDNLWDFNSLTPESIPMTMWVMSDRAIPRLFRFMGGFGVKIVCRSARCKSAKPLIERAITIHFHEFYKDNQNSNNKQTD
jgi:hypothetical protein